MPVEQQLGLNFDYSDYDEDHQNQQLSLSLGSQMHDEDREAQLAPLTQQEYVAN